MQKVTNKVKTITELDGYDQMVLVVPTAGKNISKVPSSLLKRDLHLLIEEEIL